MLEHNFKILSVCNSNVNCYRMNNYRKTYDNSCNAKLISFQANSGEPLKLLDMLLKNKYVQNILSLAQKNPILFKASLATILALSIRPLTILAVPGAKKKDKQYAATKSIVSGAVSFGIACGISWPLQKAIEKFKVAAENGTLEKSLKKPLTKERFEAFNYFVITGAYFIVIPLEAFLLFKAIPKVINLIFPDKIAHTAKVPMTAPFSFNQKTQSTFKSFVMESK